jgi:hypothetical protein
MPDVTCRCAVNTRSEPQPLYFGRWRRRLGWQYIGRRLGHGLNDQPRWGCGFRRRWWRWWRWWRRRYDWFWGWWRRYWLRWRRRPGTYNRPRTRCGTRRRLHDRPWWLSGLLMRADNITVYRHGRILDRSPWKAVCRRMRRDRYFFFPDLNPAVSNDNIRIKAAFAPVGNYCGIRSYLGFGRRRVPWICMQIKNRAGITILHAALLPLTRLILIRGAVGIISHIAPL